MNELTHYSLCKHTAEWYVKKANIAFYEYKGWTAEEPDVLGFNGHTTTLFEIKMSRSDFLRDKHKDCRTKWKPKGYWSLWNNKKLNKQMLKWKQYAPELYYIESPHLGVYRYYVCPSGLIKPEDIPEGWGLIWFKNGRFYKKIISKKFKRNLYSENLILVHGIRRIASEGYKGIIIRTYEVDNEG